MNEENLFKSALLAQDRHVRFLNATEDNLSNYFFGKKISLGANTSTLYPRLNLVDAIASNRPNPDNPVYYLVNAFIDEIIESEWTLDVSAKDDLISDIWEDKIKSVHRKSKRRIHFKKLILEMFTHAYFGIYFDGDKWYPLTSYDVFPGDASIPTWQEQPFITRLTKVKKNYIVDNLNYNKSCDSFLSSLSDLNDVFVYDIWCKDLNKNVAYLQNGEILYSQEFPVKGIYPIFGAVDTELINSFYTVPVMLVLSELLKEFQESISSIKKSSKSIANPLLVYDVDSGIDIDAVVQKMKQDYKQIIVGKNREGDIGFRAPGNLPGYAINMPVSVIDQMMKFLGINDAFLGNPMAGVRERGALTNLIKASFRKLESKVILLEEAFSDLDNYIIAYYKDHNKKFKETSDFETPEDFFLVKDVEAEERLTQFLNKDNTEEKNLTMNKFRAGLISQRTALKELGHTQPDKIIKEQQNEAMLRELFKVDVQRRTSEMARKDSLVLAFEKLKGRLQNKFWLTPIEGDKVVVSVHSSDKDKAAKLLLDLNDKVLIKVVKEKEERPADQDSMDIRQQPMVPEVESVSQQPIPEQQVQVQAATPAAEEITSNEELLKKVAELSGQAPNKEEETKEEEKDIQSFLKELEGTSKKPERESGAEKGAVPTPRETKPFLDELVEATLKNRKKIKPTADLMRLKALYFKEPIAKNLATGKQLVFLKPKNMPELLEEKFLLAGKKVYGVITVREIIDDFDFEETFKYHQMTDASRQKNWGDAKLYLYVFDFEEFETPVDYDVEPGAKNIITIKNPKI